MNFRELKRPPGRVQPPKDEANIRGFPVLEHASWQFIKRDARVTYFGFNFTDTVEGLRYSSRWPVAFHCPSSGMTRLARGTLTDRLAVSGR